MYELGKDRARMAMIESLADRSPRDAVIQMQRFAQSIKDNDSAKSQRHASEPLSQLRPSNVHPGKDDGANTVRDMRSKYRA